MLIHIPVAAPALLPMHILVAWITKIEERDADLYGRRNAEEFIKTHKVGERPKSRLRRLLRWLFSTHPPPWVRASERYYDKGVSLWRLFAEDLRR